jgi:plastocyanin
MNRQISLVLSSIIILSITVTEGTLSITTNINAAKAEANTITTAIPHGSVIVQAGGGNKTLPLSRFLPQEVQIKAGQSVTWYNPSQLADPHTVTFVFDNQSMTGQFSQFGISNSTKFNILRSNPNSQPLIGYGKNGANTITAVNARVSDPAVIDTLGNVKVMKPNANYTMTGTEKYVNSGWLLPKGQEKVFPGSSNIFTVTFKKVGKYDYFCMVHPWMVGTVIVK